MRLAAVYALRLVRTLLVLVLVALGATVLVRYAPGYFSDAREMDARFAGTARARLGAEEQRSASLPRLLAAEAWGWLHADLGTSRQYNLPVAELIAPRLAVTGGLLVRSILLAWLLSGLGAVALNLRRAPWPVWRLPSTVVLALPAAALATVCLMLGWTEPGAAPVLVMTLLLAARDFKFLDRLLAQAWRAPQIDYARAQGIRRGRLLLRHVLPAAVPQLGGLVMLSSLTALSAVVPVEVIFGVPGLGQLAWNAALNRDLPVLLAVTMLLAVAVTASGLAAERPVSEREYV